MPTMRGASPGELRAHAREVEVRKRPSGPVPSRLAEDRVDVRRREEDHGASQNAENDSLFRVRKQPPHHRPHLGPRQGDQVPAQQSFPVGDVFRPIPDFGDERPPKRVMPELRALEQSVTGPFRGQIVVLARAEVSVDFLARMP